MIWRGLKFNIGCNNRCWFGYENLPCHEESSLRMVRDTVLLSRGNDKKFIIWQWFWKLLLYICMDWQNWQFLVFHHEVPNHDGASSSSSLLLSNVYSMRGKVSGALVFDGVARPSPSIIGISPLQILKERELLIKPGTHHIVAFLLTILLDLIR